MKLWTQAGNTVFHGEVEDALLEADDEHTDGDPDGDPEDGVNDQDDEIANPTPTQYAQEIVEYLAAARGT